MIRIVKMTFEPEFIPEFLALFIEIKQKIKDMPGCQSLTMLQDRQRPEIFFTYSQWLDAKDLEHYRNSALFTKTWQTIKPHFAQKAEAWSVDTIYNL